MIGLALALAVPSAEHVVIRVSTPGDQCFATVRNRRFDVRSKPDTFGKALLQLQTTAEIHVRTWDKHPSYHCMMRVFAIMRRHGIGPIAYVGAYVTD